MLERAERIVRAELKCRFQNLMTCDRGDFVPARSPIHRGLAIKPLLSYYTPKNSAVDVIFEAELS